MTIIKRYSNRKLYDSAAARYVTLDELGDRIRAGEEINVVDHESGADLTAMTLMQIMFEREKKVGGMLPKAILTTFIQAGSTAVDALRSGLNSLVENSPAMEAEIRRRAKILVEDGQVAVEEAQRWTDMLLSNRWKQRDTTAEKSAAAPVEEPASPEPPPSPASAAVYPAEPVAPPAPPMPDMIVEEAPPPAPGEVERLQQQIADLERKIAEIKAGRKS